MPITNPVDVDLAEQLGFAVEHPEQLAVGGLAQLGPRRVGVALHLVARHRPLIAVDARPELESVGGQRVDGQQCLDAVGVLQVDHLLAALVEAELAQPSQVCQVVVVVRLVGQRRQQPVGGRRVQLLPPQGEEQRAVGQGGQRVTHPAAQRQRPLRAGVRGEVQHREARQQIHALDQHVEAAQRIDQRLRRQIARQRVAQGLEIHHLALEIRDRRGHRRLVRVGQQLAEPPGPCHGTRWTSVVESALIAVGSGARGRAGRTGRAGASKS